MHRSLAGVIECAWDATPVGLERKPWGHAVVAFVRHRGKGRMEWEVDDASRLVKRVTAWDGQGRLEWDETRGFEMRLGREILVSRHRVVSGGTQDETLTWTALDGDVQAADVPTPAQ
jgi:hypothetical protein